MATWDDQNPADDDIVSQYPANQRAFRNLLSTRFPNVDGVVTATHEELSLLSGLVVDAAILNLLDGLTAEAADLNRTADISATNAESLIDRAAGDGRYTRREQNGADFADNALVRTNLNVLRAGTAGDQARTNDQNDARFGRIPSGTRMLFQQSNAPPDWTKVTSGIHNRALRLVTGSVGGTGSGNSFTTAFRSNHSHNHGGTNNTTLSTSQMPSHDHSLQTVDQTSTGTNDGVVVSNDAIGSPINRSDHVNNAGGGGSHSHSISTSSFNLNVQYLDVICAVKD